MDYTERKERVVSDRCLVLYNSESLHDWHHVKYVPVYPAFTVVPDPKIDQNTSVLVHNEIKECIKCKLMGVFSHKGAFLEVLTTVIS